MPEIAGTHVPLVTLAAFGAAAALTLAAGSVFTRIDAWYEGLSKPSWTPPGIVIALAWWTIFALVAVAMALAWSAAPPDALAVAVVAVLAGNLVLNAGWSFLFFTRHDPRSAFLDVLVLEGSILLLAALVVPRSRTAAALLAPYAAWVAFAASLNYAILRANP